MTRSEGDKPIMLPGPKPLPTGLTRRSFLIALGGCAAATLAGYFLADSAETGWSGLEKKVFSGGDLPRLRTGLQWGVSDGLTTLRRPGVPLPAECAVNECGRLILEQLDGRHRIEDLAQAVQSRFGCGRTEAMDAGIARFVATLGDLGFLDAPYYAMIVERLG